MPSRPSSARTAQEVAQRRSSSTPQNGATAWGGVARSRNGTARASTARDFFNKTADRAHNAAASLGGRSGGGGPLRVPSKPRRKFNSRRVQPSLVPSMAVFGMTGDLEGALYARLLTSKLEDSDPRSRTWTAKALGSLGSEASPQIAALKRAVTDEDLRVRNAVRTAIRRIRGKRSKSEAAATSKRRPKSGSRRSSGRQQATPERSSGYGYNRPHSAPLVPQR